MGAKNKISDRYEMSRTEVQFFKAPLKDGGGKVDMWYINRG